MTVLEALMVLAFGVSWPFSIAKALRTRVVAGKSPVFLTLIMIGYGFGIAHKLLSALDWVVVLYAANLLMVGTDILLYIRFRPKGRARAETRGRHAKSSG
jgi:hypothetical protein